MQSNSYTGKGLNRVDGFAKVIGEAKYAGKFIMLHLLYDVVISSVVIKEKLLLFKQKMR